MIAPLKDTSLQGYQFAFAHIRFTKVLRLARLKTPGTRSEERRVGKEC